MKSLSFGKVMATAAASAMLIGTPVLVAAPAAAAPKTIVAPERLITLDGTQNTRTFDGYTTADHKSISSAVIRSDNLSKLSVGDKTILAKRKVTSVIDLRTSLERAAQPDHAIPGAKSYENDILGATPVTNLIDLDSAYRSFITDRQARAGFASTLRIVTRTVAAGDSVIFHCSAGKDRTGWTSALILTIAGVDRATVERDYLASNTYRHASPNDPLNGVHISWLRASFTTADKVYGSFDNYIRKGLGLSAKEVTALRDAVRVPQRVY
ncbi:tyrosine-protein phosphatase [Gordonia sp. CPCC 205333]|uniref:tyrosine-protein phosphatase n=1 Tax=Gordonia sp. CPCC 205333 TaxID=3140790 RepID=UPI003AF3460F